MPQRSAPQAFKRVQSSARTGVEQTGSRARERAEALRALGLGGQVVYAVRLPDGIIKIGCTIRLDRRRKGIHPQAEILGFVPGTYEDEQEIHELLAAHRAYGREWYHPTAEVLAVVNEMRDRFNLPHLVDTDREAAS